jgi:hypothetical protein
MMNNTENMTVYMSQDIDEYITFKQYELKVLYKDSDDVTCIQRFNKKESNLCDFMSTDLLRLFTRMLAADETIESVSVYIGEYEVAFMQYDFDEVFEGLELDDLREDDIDAHHAKELEEYEQEREREEEMRYLNHYYYMTR